MSQIPPAVGEGKTLSKRAGRRVGALLTSAVFVAGAAAVAPTAASAAPFDESDPIAAAAAVPAEEWQSAPGYQVAVLEGDDVGGRVAPLPANFRSSAAGDD